MNETFSYLGKIREINGKIYIYAKVHGFYGWYTVEPIELPEENELLENK